MAWRHSLLCLAARQETSAAQAAMQGGNAQWLQTPSSCAGHVYNARTRLNADEL